MESVSPSFPAEIDPLFVVCCTRSFDRQNAQTAPFLKYVTRKDFWTAGFKYRIDGTVFCPTCMCLSASHFLAVLFFDLRDLTCCLGLCRVYNLMLCRY